MPSKPGHLLIVFLLTIPLFSCHQGIVHKSKIQSLKGSDIAAGATENDADAEAQDEVAMEPVAVAGASLFCQSQNVIETSESISCALRDRDGQTKVFKNIEIKQVLVRYVDDQIAPADALTMENQDPWLFSMLAKRFAVEVELRALIDGLEQSFKAPIVSQDIKQIRFEQAAMAPNQWIHLGDGDSVGGDDCAEEFGLEDLISAGTFYRGLSMEIGFTLTESTFLQLNLLGGCDVNADGQNRMQLASLSNDSSNVLLDRVLATDGSQNFVAESFSAGSYKIRIISDFVGDTDRYDEFMFRNFFILSSKPVKDFKVSFVAP